MNISMPKTDNVVLSENQIKVAIFNYLYSAGYVIDPNVLELTVTPKTKEVSIGPGALETITIGHDVSCSIDVHRLNGGHDVGQEVKDDPTSAIDHASRNADLLKTRKLDWIFKDLRGFLERPPAKLITCNVHHDGMFFSIPKALDKGIMVTNQNHAANRLSINGELPATIVMHSGVIDVRGQELYDGCIVTSPNTQESMGSAKIPGLVYYDDLSLRWMIRYYHSVRRIDMPLDSILCRKHGTNHTIIGDVFSHPEKLADEMPCDNDRHLSFSARAVIEPSMNMDAYRDLKMNQDELEALNALGRIGSTQSRINVLQDAGKKAQRRK